MSCSTLSQAFVSLNVSMGSLPEGFCPSSMQDLANSIATRLIITPNQAFSTFAIGSVEPSGNIGPWLKDCSQWFVFDDSTGHYIPTKKGGFDTIQYFVANTTFTVPAFIYKLKVHAWGGGGGGSDVEAGAAGGGGGAGGYGISIFNVNPGDNINITVGTGGAGGATGTTGGDTTVLTMVSKGGIGAPAGHLHSGGDGGQVNGATFFSQGGAGGGGAGSSSGNGGSSPCGGQGGTDSETNSSLFDAKSPGGGGAGGDNTAGRTTGGVGAQGGVLIEY